MENRGIVKVCQVGHIFAFFVFGWIDLSNEIFLEILGLFLVRHFIFKSGKEIFLFRQIEVLFLDNIEGSIFISPDTCVVIF